MAFVADQRPKDYEAELAFKKLELSDKAKTIAGEAQDILDQRISDDFTLWKQKVEGIFGEFTGALQQVQKQQADTAAKGNGNWLLIALAAAVIWWLWKGGR